MKPLLIILGTLSALALALTIVPPLLFWAGQIDLPAVKRAMFAGMVLWFATAVPLSKYSAND